ncbi:MAG: DUF2339 domain-containing protein, partial [Thermoleophilia bacterium]|nr:DUF2339 domain-containing protein [Thermoleophilia bacterium]
MADVEISSRIEELERRLGEVQRELEELKALAAVPGTERLEARSEAEPQLALTVTAPVPVLHRAWRALERGERVAAIDLAVEALEGALAARDLGALDELAAFAQVAARSAVGADRDRAHELGLRIAGVRSAITAPVEPAPAAVAPPPEPEARPEPVPRPARVAPAPPAPVPPAPREPLGPPLSARVAAWVRAELTGARLFALVGGIVTLLGVVFFFILAANRGWVGPEERVALGATASLAVLLSGVALRLRYGRLYASLGAVGAGVAGAYATLAAATVLYGYLPTWGALLCATAIASVGGWIAVSWSSQLLAGLSLLGAAAAPGLVALDDGISWEGTAFALVVFGATVAVASPRRWAWLDGAVAAVAVAQVAWLTASAAADDAGTVAVSSAASLLLLAAAAAWQAGSDEGLNEVASAFALPAGAVALWSPLAVLTDERSAGLVLLALAAVFLVVALGLGRVASWRDLGWTVGAEALLLGGIAVALMLTGRSLTIVWAVEAVALAGLGWRLGVPRFSVSGLVFVGAAVVHVVAVEVVPAWPEGVFDVPRSAAVGLFVVAAAALAVGVLVPVERRDAPGLGVAAALEPLWDGVVRERALVRLLGGVGSGVLLAMATAGVLSGRSLTVLWAALAVALASAAFGLGERRLQAAALGFLAAAVGHALAVEVPPRTLALEPESLIDPMSAVPSLLALALAFAALASLACFVDRGIAWLGPLTGGEEAFLALSARERTTRHLLAFVAAIFASWAAGLVAIDASYQAGQVVATGLWAALGTVVAALASRTPNRWWQGVGTAVVLVAVLKSAAFDWRELDDGAVATSAVVSAAALLLAGFLVRWLEPREVGDDEVWSIVSGGAAAALAVAGIERVLDIDDRALGVATLPVAAALVLAGLPAYVRWRRAPEHTTWERTLLDGYWALALAVTLVSEWLLMGQGVAGTTAVWAATGGVVALGWRPLGEDRAWLAATLVVAVTAVVCIAEVTVPNRLVEATDHP